MKPVTALWSRQGMRLAGLGAHSLHDPGTGDARYENALRLLVESDREIAFASFTFDPAEPGSIVVIPDSVDAGPVRCGDSPQTIESATAQPDESQESWRQKVQSALSQINSGSLEKVVLSRGVTIASTGNIDPYAIARTLEVTQPNSYVFLVDRLVGASPELLLRVDGNNIASVPLAGSADGSPEPLGSAKMKREHQFAADSVEDAFVKSGIAYTRAGPEVFEFDNLSHLATRFSGRSSNGITFADILRNLHPTAAVAGTPTDVAMETIRSLEGTSRGRYSGPVGWFDRSGNGEFAIALRCGLITENQVRLRSGAGIVSGSRPDEELEEINWKLAPMLNALGMSPTL